MTIETIQARAREIVELLRKAPEGPLLPAVKKAGVIAILALVADGMELVIGEDEHQCNHIYGEHNVYEGRSCHLQANYRNALRAQQRAALTRIRSEEVSNG